MNKRIIPIEERKRMEAEKENPSPIEQIRQNAFRIAIEQRRNPNGMSDIHQKVKPPETISEPLTKTIIEGVRESIRVCTTKGELSKKENRQRVAQTMKLLGKEIANLSAIKNPSYNEIKENKLRIRQLGSISKAIGEYAKRTGKNAREVAQKIQTENHDHPHSY